MVTRSPSARLSLLGVMLLWPYVLSRSVSSSLQAADSGSLSEGPGGERPHLVKRAIQMCDSTFDSYCMNSGQCMLLVDVNEHHCKCESGFYGPRCSRLELVVQPMGEEQIIVTVFCVILLIMGLAGLLYFCCKWCESGFYGPRCSRLELVVQPMGEEQIIVTVFCVILLIMGLAGLLYFCCKWYKKKQFQKQQGYKGVQMT